jgi:phosphatidylglycerophosphatase A
MLGSVDTASMAMAMLADWFGGWEIILVLSVVLILLGARRLPELGRGLRQGRTNFTKTTEDALKEKESGLVYEALTVENHTVDFVYPEKERVNILREMTLLLAQGFGVGRIPFAPGTFGSLLGLAWVAALVATGNYWLYLVGTLAGLALSVIVCGAAEKILKQRDPPSVVLDEIVALPICFLVIVTQAWVSRGKVPPVEWFLTGPNLVWTVLIFVLFRLFDIVKPWPVGQSQRLPGGWGVTVDDLLAAVYVVIITLLAPK